MSAQSGLFDRECWRERRAAALRWEIERCNVALSRGAMEPALREIWLRQRGAAQRLLEQLVGGAA